MGVASKNAWWVNVLVVAILLFALAVIYVFFRSLLQADPEVSAAIIGVIGLLLAGVWAHRSTKILEINSRHFIEKKNAYMILINLIFDLLSDSRKEEKLSKEAMIQRMLEFKRELMVWGDQTVIKALQEYEDFSLQDNKNPAQILLRVDNLLRSIRKDLGHDDSALPKGALVLMQVKAEDRDQFPLS